MKHRAPLFLLLSLVLCFHNLRAMQQVAVLAMLDQQVESIAQSDEVYDTLQASGLLTGISDMDQKMLIESLETLFERHVVIMRMNGLAYEQQPPTEAEKSAFFKTVLTLRKSFHAYQERTFVKEISRIPMAFFEQIISANALQEHDIRPFLFKSLSDYHLMSKHSDHALISVATTIFECAERQKDLLKGIFQHPRFDIQKILFGRQLIQYVLRCDLANIRIPSVAPEASFHDFKKILEQEDIVAKGEYDDLLEIYSAHLYEPLFVHAIHFKRDHRKVAWIADWMRHMLHPQYIKCRLPKADQERIDALYGALAQRPFEVYQNIMNLWEIALKKMPQ